MKRFLRLGSWE